MDLCSRLVTGFLVAITVRPAAKVDIPAIVHCATSSILEEEDAGFGPPWSERTFTDRGRLLEAWRKPNKVGTSEVYVAESNGLVVGYVTIENRPASIELGTVEVPRDLQGQGVGRSLVRFVEATARKRGMTAVTVGTSRNAEGVAWRSLPWWNALGYQVVGEEENEWTRSVGRGVREIRMRKEIERA